MIDLVYVAVIIVLANVGIALLAHGASAAGYDNHAPKASNSVDFAIAFYRDRYVADEISLEVYEIVVADLLKGES